MRTHLAAFLASAAVALSGCPRTAYHCTATSCDPSTRAICTIESEPQCAVPMSSCDSGYAYSRSAANPGTCVDRAVVSADASIESGVDAAVDSFVDAPVDSMADAADTLDSGPPDTMPAGCTAPQLISPISGSRGTSNYPRVAVQIGAGAGTGTIEFEFASSRTGFGTPEHRVTVGAMLPRTTTDVTTVLSPGIHYWRARMHCDRDAATSDWSQIWWMELPHRESRVSIPFKTYPGPLDLNGDGAYDFVIGSPGSGASGLHIYIGPVDATGSFADDPYARNDLVSFGASIANAGDLNGDGYSDLLVGGCPPPIAKSSALACSPTIWLMSGSPASTTPRFLQPPMEITRPLDAMGAAAAGWYGGPIAGVGDADGDGYGDFVAGTGVMNTSNGAVFLFRGSPSGVRPDPLRIDPPGGARGFGRAVAGVGDVAGMGRGAALVGADGLAFLVTFDASVGGANPTAHTLALSAPTGILDFGATVAAGGDRNGDGSLELLVSDPSASRVHVFASAGTSAGTWNSSGGGDEAGTTVDTGDWDADGYDDFAAGAPNASSGFGAVHIVPGAMSGMGTPVLLASPLSVPHNFGRAAAFVGSSPFGFDCVVVGAPDIGPSAPGNTQGTAYYRCQGTSSSYGIQLGRTIDPGAGAGFGLAISH